MNKILAIVFLAAVAVQGKFIPEIQDAIARYPEMLKAHGGIVSGMGRNVQSDGKIVGGNIARPGEFPHQCHLKIEVTNGTYFCGCSIISDSWILTAAHCADNVLSITVTMGDHDLDLEEGTEVRSVATKITRHENYGSILIRNDVAVLKIDPVTLNGNIKTICLAKDGAETYVGQNATVSGWGKENDNSTSVARQLSYVDVQVIPNSECVSNYSALTVTANNICTSVNGDKGSCQGDSGGPLIITNADGKVEQIGIVSFGSNAGCTKAPSVYARVSSFLSWIVQNVDPGVVNVGC